MSKSAESVYPNLHTPSFLGQEGRDPLEGKKLELSLSCSEIKYADSTKTNTMVVLFMKGGTPPDWQEHGRTELIKGEENPEFVTKFIIERYFEESAENLKFSVYNVDPKVQDISQETPLGDVFCAVGKIATARGKKFTTEIRSNNEERGKLSIRWEEPDSCKDVVYMSWEGKNSNKLFSKRSLYLQFKRSKEDNTFTPVLRTALSSSNPASWKDLEVSVQKLCNGDGERTIQVDVCEDGKHQPIGHFETRLNKLEKGKGHNVYQISGTKVKDISLTDFRICRQPTFQDFVNGGMELSFYVAIDFTESNGDPSDSNSLHSTIDDNRNQYEQAIEAVGHVLQYYDTDNLFPAYGFGAKIPPTNKISHRFPINFNQENPSCVGVMGVLEAYKACLGKVNLDGPTNFAPIIRLVSEKASSYEDASNYSILLIITDGIYSDKDATKEAIVQAAKLPMSIIIVGVGNEDFTDMIELDGDQVRISHTGEEAERDIVQFVALRDHLNDASEIISPKKLNAQLLEEIPDQIIEYTKKRNLQPNRPPPEYSF